MPINSAIIYICDKLKEAGITIEDLQKIDIEKVKHSLMKRN